jgi:hypothetical protein
MPLFGPSREQLWREFLIQLGQAGVNPLLMDDEARALAYARGRTLFDFISGIDGVTWNELNELYQRWLARQEERPRPGAFRDHVRRVDQKLEE